MERLLPGLQLPEVYNILSIFCHFLKTFFSGWEQEQTSTCGGGLGGGGRQLPPVLPGGEGGARRLLQPYCLDL